MRLCLDFFVDSDVGGGGTYAFVLGLLVTPPGISFVRDRVRGRGPAGPVALAPYVAVLLLQL